MLVSPIPIRAAMVERPEEYRWNSLGYHIQVGNRDDFLSLDFGPAKCASLSLGELNGARLQEFGAMYAAEILRRYRRYVYAAGSINQPGKGSVKVIEDNVLEKERSRKLELSKSDRFRYRTRYFTDSGIIGSKEFVPNNYQRFKNLFESKHEKKAKPIKGLDGMYSLKRLSEA